MKKILNLGFALLSLFFLATGQFPLFALSFIVSALAFGSFSGYLYECVTSCELDSICSSTDCSVRGGIKCLYWARYGDIDWETMEADATAFDPANQCLLGYTMLDDAVFTKLKFDKKQGFYDFTFTEDADLYEILITLIFEGKSKETRNALCKAVGCCDIIAHIIDNNCLERVVGVEWDGVTFSAQVKGLRIVRHLDSSGQFGDSKARDEIDLGGEALCPPLFATVGEANIPV